MNNDDKLREQMKSEPVPDRLKPENIKIMLDNEAPKKKRSGISMAGRVAAAAAACTVIGGTAAYTLNNGKFDKKNANVTSCADMPASDESSEVNTQAAETNTTKLANYMSGAKDYEQVYTMFKAAYKKAEREYGYQTKTDEETVSSADSAIAEENGADYSFTGGTGGDGNAPEVPIIDGELPTEPDTEPVPQPTTEAVTEAPTEATTEPTTEEPTKENDTETAPEHSETYYQEQNVLEADIVKTDGKRIYYVSNLSDDSYNRSSVLRTADVKDGKFTGSATVTVSDDVMGDDEDSYCYVTDMYIYNDMIAVLGSYNNYSEDERSDTTFVAFYTTGDHPELIDIYKQAGYYSDVRISPDGYMLLQSTYSSYNFSQLSGSDDIRRYIPCCGLTKNYEAVKAEDILLPDEFGSQEWLNYSVIGSIDLNQSGAPAVSDVKTLAGFSGALYCSEDNLYVAAGNWETNCSDITRISIKGGCLEPQACGNIKGLVKDQFSMSEYGGYFRVAANYIEYEKTFHKYSDNEGFMEGLWNRIKGEDNEGGYYSYSVAKQDNRVYVLDMDMNIVGCADGLGINEQIKSASFSGNMAYIVTFRQTDPLYAVDLSDPANPVVLDELKINGFSTYMQPWGDGLLLGFGMDADDNGSTTGIKLTMFDNSDPNDLKALDTVTWNNKYIVESFTYPELTYHSDALYDRKALLIAPEKNLIGVPLHISEDHYDDNYDYHSETTTKYEFFSFEDGHFVQKGDIAFKTDNWFYYYSEYNRAIYIGDYVYALSVNRFTAADINTLKITDQLEF